MSVDVRGHDTELGVHGVFSDGRGTRFEGEVEVLVNTAMVVKLDAPKGDLADNGRRVTCRSMKSFPRVLSYTYRRRTWCIHVLGVPV